MSLCLSFFKIFFSPDPSRSEPTVAERRIPTGRDPRRRGPGPHSSQSHGFLHLLLLLWWPVLLPAVNSTAALFLSTAPAPQEAKPPPLKRKPSARQAHVRVAAPPDVLPHRVPAAMSLISSASCFLDRRPETSLTLLLFFFFNCCCNAVLQKGHSVRA